MQLFHTLKEFVLLRQLFLLWMVYCDIFPSLLFVLLKRGLAEYGELMIFLGAEEKRGLIIERRGSPGVPTAWHMKLGTVRVWCRRTLQLSHSKRCETNETLVAAYRYCRAKRYTQVSKFEPETRVSCITGTILPTTYEDFHYSR